MPKILIVDDEPLVCEMLAMTLLRAGYDVETASDGQQALSATSKAQFDLIIADIVMPEMDGLETIQRVLKQTPDAKIIAISGGSRIGNFDFLETARKFEAVRTFYKPLDNRELLIAVQECLEA